MSYLDRDLIRIGVDVEKQNEVIEMLGMLMEEKQLVKPTYVQAVLDREKIYPTGLPTRGISVAIPHTDSSHVKKSAIGLAVLHQPVGFSLMGGDGSEQIDAQIVFLLAISDSKAQIELLKKLMRLFQNDEVLSKIVAAEEVEVIYEYLDEALKN